MKRKKVMIYAYCNYNLGDDLFIKILCERYPETQFLLYAPSDYKNHFKELSNLTVYSKESIVYRLLNYAFRKMKINNDTRTIISQKSDAIVQIGGSIFMQKDNWDSNINHKSLEINKPYYVLGANFGPYTDEDFYNYHYNKFKRYTDICFRDNYSYELFNTLDNVRKADDIVFQLSKENSNTTEKKIVISVIKPSFRKDLKGYDEIYFNKIKDIAIYFVDKGYDVILMSFCENEGDREAIREIINIIPEDKLDKVKQYYYKSNIEEALNLISSSAYIVATRFHAMILGWLYEKPVFPISYSGKMNNVMRDLKYTGSYIDLKEIDTLDPKVTYEGIEENFVDVSKQIENSKQHFNVLDKFLLK